MTLDQVIAELQRRLDPRPRTKTFGLFSGAPLTMLDILPRIVCAGFTFSMQAGKFNYCSPRDDTGPWTEVELGFPTEKVEAWQQYAEEPAKPTETARGDHGQYRLGDPGRRSGDVCKVRGQYPP